MNEEHRPVFHAFRRLNLIDALINADDEDPRAQQLGTKLILSRTLNAFGHVEIRDSELWLTFYDESQPCRVTDDSIPAIVELIQKHRC